MTQLLVREGSHADVEPFSYDVAAAAAAAAALAAAAATVSTVRYGCFDEALF